MNIRFRKIASLSLMLMMSVSVFVPELVRAYNNEPEPVWFSYEVGCGKKNTNQNKDQGFGIDIIAIGNTQYTATLKKTDTGVLLNNGDEILPGTKITLATERGPLQWFISGGANDSPFGWWNEGGIVKGNMYNPENTIDFSNFGDDAFVQGECDFSKPITDDFGNQWVYRSDSSLAIGSNWGKAVWGDGINLAVVGDKKAPIYTLSGTAKYTCDTPRSVEPLDVDCMITGAGSLMVNIKFPTTNINYFDMLPDSADYLGAERLWERDFIWNLGVYENPVGCPINESFSWSKPYDASVNCGGAISTVVPHNGSIDIPNTLPGTVGHKGLICHNGTLEHVSLACDIATTTSSPTAGACGSANSKSYPYGATGYGGDAQCAFGTSSNTAFPNAGETVSWNCVNEGSPSGTCSAQTMSNAATPPPAGVCGTANRKTYLKDVTGYDPDTQCSSGTSSNTAFPNVGQSVSWKCVNGGVSSGSCSAQRAIGGGWNEIPPSF